jgi:two-component system, OmpR family, alkaline phosphatase synthesis response regulator PhoP
MINKTSVMFDPVEMPLTWKEFICQITKQPVEWERFEINTSAMFGQVRIDFLSMEVHRSDRLVIMTAMEFKVLKFFVSNPKRVISRDELLNEVWGYNNYPSTRTVDNHVLKLRQKLEPDAPNPVYFQTVRGVGYKFVP